MLIGPASQAVQVGGSEGWAVIAPADTVTPDLAQGVHQDLTLNRPTTTINAPVNATPGGRMILIIRQDAVGGRSIAFGPGYTGGGQFGIAGWPGAVSVFCYSLDVGAKPILTASPAVGI